MQKYAVAYLCRGAFFSDRPEFPYVVIKADTLYNRQKRSKFYRTLLVHDGFNDIVKVRGF